MGYRHYAEKYAVRKVCLVTGAGGSLGSALCRTFLERGYDVMGIYRSTLPSVDSQVAELVPIEGAFWANDMMRKRETSAYAGRRAYVAQADLSQLGEISRVVQICIARYDRVDVLVNAAADSRFHGRLTELSAQPGYAISQLGINVVSPMLLSSVIFQHDWKYDPSANMNRNACVLNISSISGLIVGPAQGQGFYAASKAALNMLTMHLAVELAAYGVRANALCPSRWDTSKELGLVVRRTVDIIEGHETGIVY
jgi:NAD(P)-dependent dehydrogenase (short-subunit alcohol dehydrogenase family)